MKPFNQEVLEVIVSNPGIRAAKLYAILNRPIGTIEKHVSALVNLGHITRALVSGRMTYRPSRQATETYERAQPLRKRYALAVEALGLAMDFDNHPRRAIWLFRYLWGPKDTGRSLYHKCTYGGYNARRLPTSKVLSPPWELWRLRSRVEAIETLCRLPASLLCSLSAGPVNWKSRAVSTHEKGGVIDPLVASAWRELSQ